MKKDIEKVGTECAVCGPESDEVVAVVREHEYSNTTEDLFTLVRCRRCGAIRLNPRPAVSEISTIYPSDYFAYDLNPAAGGNKWSPKAISLRRESRRLSSLVRRHSVRAPQSVYDIGCGDGTTLSLMAELFGPNVRTFGCEVNADASARARNAGHDIQNSLFEECELDRNTYDLLLSSHVIEHVASPREFLSKAASMMGPESVFILDTPNVANPVRRLFGRHWGGWHTPRHWNLFDPRSISELADKTGLQVVAIQQMTINMFWVWGMHSLVATKYPRTAEKFFNPRKTITGGTWSLLSLVLFQVLDRVLLVITRRGGQMRVVLKQSSGN